MATVRELSNLSVFNVRYQCGACLTGSLEFSYIKKQTLIEWIKVAPFKYMHKCTNSSCINHADPMEFDKKYPYTAIIKEDGSEQQISIDHSATN